MATKQIPLTQGKFALVDEEDFEYLNQWKWHAQKGRKTFYAVRGIFLNSKNKSIFNTSLIYMHHLILARREGCSIDHIDGNGLNNLRSNLRHATRGQNRMNTEKSCNNTTGFKGVSFYKQANKFRARITLDKKQIFLGYFETAQEAHQAYIKAAIELHGEFAKW